MSRKLTPPNQLRYDADMIRDFILHYIWECRSAAHTFRHSHSVHPELADTAARYARKYNTPTLVPIIVLNDDTGSPGEFQRAVESFQSNSAEIYENRADLLESLLPSLEESLDCSKVRLSRVGDIPFSAYSAREWLDLEGGKE